MRKTLSLLTSMLVVSGSSVLTIACDSSSSKAVKSYLDWYHNEVKCVPGEDVYETEWGIGRTHEGIILYCAKNIEDADIRLTSELKAITNKYNLNPTGTSHIGLSTFANEQKQYGKL